MRRHNLFLMVFSFFILNFVNVDTCSFFTSVDYIFFVAVYHSMSLISCVLIFSFLLVSAERAVLVVMLRDIAKKI